MAVTHDRRDPAPENRTLAISVALLVVLTLAVFLPSLGYEFVNYDDPIMIANNPHVANGVSIDGLRWAFTTFYGANWFPLTWISWMLGASLFGLDARAFHAKTGGNGLSYSRRRARYNGPFFLKSHILCSLG